MALYQQVSLYPPSLSLFLSLSSLCFSLSLFLCFSVSLFLPFSLSIFPTSLSLSLSPPPLSPPPLSPCPPPPPRMFPHLSGFFSASITTLGLSDIMSTLMNLNFPTLPLHSPSQMPLGFLSMTWMMSPAWKKKKKNWMMMMMMMRTALRGGWGGQRWGVGGEGRVGRRWLATLRGRLPGGGGGPVLKKLFPLACRCLWQTKKISNPKQ